jgi:hypothetical protein
VKRNRCSTTSNYESDTKMVVCVSGLMNHCSVSVFKKKIQLLLSWSVDLKESLVSYYGQTIFSLAFGAEKSDMTLGLMICTHNLFMDHHTLLALFVFVTYL